MRYALVIIEVGALAIAAIFGFLWVRNPNGPYEPITFIALLIGGSVVEFIRRHVPLRNDTRGVAAVVCLVAVLVAAVRAFVVRTLEQAVSPTVTVSRITDQPRLPGSTESRQPDRTREPVRLSTIRVAFDDGGTQYSGGCPSGAFFAVPTASIARNLTGDPAELPGVAVLLPGAAFIAIDTDLPPSDYIRITKLKFVVERYSPAPVRPPLFVQNGACADAGPDSALHMFNVVLDPRNRTVSLLAGTTEAQEQVAVWQNEPATFGFEVMARAPGWYRCNIELEYTHRSQSYVATLLRPLEVFMPSSGSYEWYHGWYGEKPRLMSDEEVGETIRKIGEWSASPFPAPPALPQQRSGRVSPERADF